MRKGDDLYALRAMPRRLGYAIFFGATCRACGWEMRDPSFSIASLAGEEHAKKHGIDLLANIGKNFHPVYRRYILWKGRPIVDIWKEDGL